MLNYRLGTVNEKQGHMPMFVIKSIAIKIYGLGYGSINCKDNMYCFVSIFIVNSYCVEVEHAFANTQNL